MSSRSIVCIVAAAVTALSCLSALSSGAALAQTDWQLTERVRVIDVVNRLFIETDNKNWKELERIFARKVRFDVSSLAGGKPSTMTGKQIAAAWKKGLEPVKQVHHQTGNVLVEIKGKAAKVFCYGTATHYRPENKKRPITTFVGSYDLHLTQSKAGWVIDGFKFNKKYVHAH